MSEISLTYSKSGSSIMYKLHNPKLKPTENSTVWLLQYMKHYIFVGLLSLGVFKSSFLCGYIPILCEYFVLQFPCIASNCKNM